MCIRDSVEAVAAIENPAREVPKLAPVPSFGVTQAPPKEGVPNPVSELRQIDTALSVPLNVAISGVRNTAGRVLILVFDSQSAYDGYDYERAVGYAEVAPTNDTIKYAFDDLTTGPYAVTIIHDENGNYDLDLKDGYPIEGYGTTGANLSLIHI